MAPDMVPTSMRKAGRIALEVVGSVAFATLVLGVFGVLMVAEYSRKAYLAVKKPVWRDPLFEGVSLEYDDKGE